MGEDPQLDLRVVGSQEQVAGLVGHERLADLPALVTAHRDILKIGIARAKPPGRRHALVERRVDPAIVGVHEFRQCIEVGPLQLRELPVLEQELGNGCSSASSSSTSCAVLCSPPGVLASDGSLSSSKSTWRS